MKPSIPLVLALIAGTLMANTAFAHDRHGAPPPRGHSERHDAPPPWVYRRHHQHRHDHDRRDHRDHRRHDRYGYGKQHRRDWYQGERRDHARHDRPYRRHDGLNVILSYKLHL